MILVSVAVEGASDEAVVRRVLSEAGCEVSAVYGLRGKSSVDSRLRGFNNAARFSPWLVVRDLDEDGPCAAELTAGLLPSPARWMRFRLAVHAMEAWLLADRQKFAEFFRVSLAKVPTRPDDVPNPKLQVVALARASRSSAIRDDVVPMEGSSARVGPGYVSRLSTFASDSWRPKVAAAHSPSLRRCLARLGEFSAYDPSSGE